MKELVCRAESPIYSKQASNESTAKERTNEAEKYRKSKEKKKSLQEESGVGRRKRKK